jgi:hypothetical protein
MNMSNERERYNIDLSMSNETGDSRSAGSRVHGRKEGEVQTLIKGIHATPAGPVADSDAVDAIGMRSNIPQIEHTLQSYAGKHRGQDTALNEPATVQAPSPSVPAAPPVVPVKTSPFGGGKESKGPEFPDPTPAANGDRKATNGKGTIAAPVPPPVYSSDEQDFYSEAKERVVAAHHQWEKMDDPNAPQ